MSILLIPHNFLESMLSIAYCSSTSQTDLSELVYRNWFTQKWPVSKSQTVLIMLYKSLPINLVINEAEN